MPKIQAIINQFAKKCPPVLPEISQAFESDPERITEALKQRGKGQDYYINLRILHYKVLRMLRPKEQKQFLKPLLQINPNDLSQHLKIEALLHICEGIIFAQDQYRTNTIDKYIADLSKLPLNITQNARLEIISAGNYFLKGDYVKAAAEYLAAARMEAFVHDETSKTNLVEHAIAFVFIAPIGVDSHKIICALCLNETVKKSKLFPFVAKLYRQDIFTQQEVNSIAANIPNILREKDREGVSILQKAAFSRNMIPIINSFSTVKLQTLVRLSGVSSVDQLLVLLEKTYHCGQVSIDQMREVVHINTQSDPSETVKEFLTQIDTILAE